MTMKSKQSIFSDHRASFPRISELKEAVQETLAWCNHNYAVLQPMWKMSYRFNHNQKLLLGKFFSPRSFLWKLLFMWHHHAKPVGLWVRSLGIAVCEYCWRFWSKGKAEAVIKFQLWAKWCSSPKFLLLTQSLQLHCGPGKLRDLVTGHLESYSALHSNPILNDLQPHPTVTILLTLF